MTRSGSGAGIMLALLLAGAAACSGARSGGADSAVDASSVASLAADSVAAAASPPAAVQPAPATSAPTGTAATSASAGADADRKSAGTPPRVSRRPGADTSRSLPGADTVRTLPERPSDAPVGPLAFIQFRESLRDSDVVWLRGEGFTIVRLMPASRAASVRVPANYTKNPRDNPRVEQFQVRQR